MKGLIDRPRVLGLVCAVSAVCLGLAYMAAAGAPPRYLLVNLAALILGAAVWFGLGRWASSRPARNGQVVLALALPLLATALFAAEVDGASRWVTVGPLSVQVSLIVVPAIIVLYARSADAIGTAGIAIAAFALAAQPDRAMAGVLAAGMAAVLLTKRSRFAGFAFAAAAAGFGATMLLPDALPAVPFVDRILYTAFDVHVAAGLAVMAGCLILIAPALIGALQTTHERPVMAAFGACWATVVAAAAIGNYPTPLVGYGGSAVLGYLISAALLPSRVRGEREAESGGAKSPVAGSSVTKSVKPSSYMQSGET